MRAGGGKGGAEAGAGAAGQTGDGQQQLSKYQREWHRSHTHPACLLTWSKIDEDDMEFLHELVDIDKDGRISFRVRGGAAAAPLGQGDGEGGWGQASKGGGGM